MSVAAGTALDTSPRVTLVAHDIHEGGGMERAYAELIRALHSDFDLQIVSASLAEDLRPLVTWHPVRVPTRPAPLKFALFFLQAGIKVRGINADLVHTLGAIVPNRADIATVQFCHAGYLASTGRLAPATAPPLRRLNTSITRAIALRAERWCYRPERLRAFAAVSIGVGSEAERHYPGIPVSITPNGIDPARFRPNPEERGSTRHKLAAGGSCVALFVGGDWDRKGLSIAIEAVAEAWAGGADVVLWVVGQGDEGRFRSQADGLGLGGRVTFFGRRTDTERYYQAADVFLFPSAYEAFPLVCIEAAACGLPLIVPSINGVAELVGQNAAGIIVDRDCSAIASALTDLAVNTSRRFALAAQAQRCGAHYTWTASVAPVAELYCSLLAEACRT